MISKRSAHKVYDRNTRVIRKGDKDWKSDNHHLGREGESYGMNPLSKMDQGIRQRASREVDMELLPSVDDLNVGDVVAIPMENGRDLIAFRLVEHVEVMMASDPEQTWERRRRQWKQAWIERNGALKE